MGTRRTASAARAAPARKPPRDAGKARAGPRSSLDKMLEILDLFEEAEQGWTAERMMRRLLCPRSTLYRYLRVLTHAGLVTSLPDVGYTLGPRIAELDFEMRSTDPLITNGRPLLQALAREVDGIGLLCRHYRDRVLCVHQEADSAPIRSGYERGRAMPLVRGAASRVILAHLKPAHFRKYYERHAAEFGRAGLGRSLAGAQEELKRIRKAGWCLTRGEVTPGVIGIAAPVFDSEGTVIGSLSVTLRPSGASERRLRSIAERVVFSAQVLTNAMTGANSRRAAAAA
jgi:DNA-binding IclR family transcriptional regulator